MTDEYTPPLHTKPGRWFSGKFTTYILDDKYEKFAEVREDTEEASSNRAQFIVKACNMHDELVAEHIAWSKNIGEAFVLAMQGDYELVDTLAKNTELVFIDGVPRLRSEPLAKAEATVK